MDTDDEDDSPGIGPDGDFIPYAEENRQIQAILTGRVKEAEAAGLSQTGSTRLHALLTRFIDVFRLQFRPEDDHVRVDPLQVTLKPDARSFQCRQRRYPPAHVDYLRQHLGLLTRAKKFQRVHKSLYTSPAYCVPKGNGLRMTLDSREPNAQTLPLAFPMPDLESIWHRLTGAKVFFQSGRF